MSGRRLHLLAALALGAALAGGCRTAAPAQLTLVGMRPADAARADVRDGDAVLYVQVVNRARRPMRLERLSYTFGADGAGHASNIELGRNVAAGSSVVVEVPVDLLAPAPGDAPLTLRGRLFATLDDIEQSFPIAMQADLATP